MVGPWLHSLWKRGRRLSDIEFMAVKAFDGKLIVVEGESTSTGELLSYVPANGKKFYFAGGHVQHIGGAPTLSHAWDAELKNDSTIVDRAGAHGTITNGIGAQTALPQIFQLKGDLLEGDGAKKYSINIAANSDSLNLAGMIYGFIEDDADDPRL